MGHESVVSHLCFILKEHTAKRSIALLLICLAGCATEGGSSGTPDKSADETTSPTDVITDPTPPGHSGDKVVAPHYMSLIQEPKPYPSTITF